jgi:hypothetical protein
MFAGFDGDERAFARGLALIERTLAAIQTTPKP